MPIPKPFRSRRRARTRKRRCSSSSASCRRRTWATWHSLTGWLRPPPAQERRSSAAQAVRTAATTKDLALSPFQKLDNYPQWKSQIATPALQQYLGNKIDLNTLGQRLITGWQTVNG